MQAKRAKLDAELTRRNINSVTSIELQDEAKAVVRASRKRKAPAKDKVGKGRQRRAATANVGVHTCRSTSC